MATYSILRTWLECTQGTSDKFYQAFLIGRQDSSGSEGGHKTITVGHYGPRKVSDGLFSRPVRGGNVAIYVSAAKYGALVQEKKKKGYRDTAGDQKQDTFDDVGSFIVHIKEQFGSSHGHDILQHFGLTLDGDEVAVPEPSVAPDTSISEDDRPEGWGAW